MTIRPNTLCVIAIRKNETVTLPAYLGRTCTVVSPPMRWIADDGETFIVYDCAFPEGGYGAYVDARALKPLCDPSVNPDVSTVHIPERVGGFR